MNWIFKFSDLGSEFNVKRNPIILLKQKRNFIGKIGDKVIGLEKIKWEFTALYVISEINIKYLEAENKEIEITLELKEIFYSKKKLDDYIYSIKRITNFSTPIKHFSRKYSRISNVEYEAIVNDDIYTNRTIFGTVFNAMHPIHQRSYLHNLMLTDPEVLMLKPNIERALALLKQYLEFAVINPAFYLKESFKILQSILPESDTQEIGFSESFESQNRNENQILYKQVNVIDKNLDELISFILLNDIEQSGSPKIKKIKNFYKNTPLPISLN